MNSDHTPPPDKQNAIRSFRFTPLKSDPDATYRKVWHKIAHEPVVRNRDAQVWKYLSIAAIVTLLIACTLFFYYQTPEHPQTAWLEVTAVPGAKTRLELSDSSVIVLNSHATIRYPQLFSGDTRTVHFSGEAMFNIKSDKKKPFVVSINSMEIKVLGTQFNVVARSDSETVEMTLLEGSIGVFTENNRTSVPDLILKPDQQAVYHKESGKLAVKDVNAAFYASWVSGDFIFRNNTLEEIMQILGRAFDTTIHIEGEALKAKKMQAQFIHQESLDEILSILQISARYTYKKEKGEIYIK